MEGTVKILSKILPVKISHFWKSIKSFSDIGGGSGFMTIEMCKAHPHLRGVNADLGDLTGVFDAYMAKEDPALASRVTFRALDFFKEPMPSDVDALMFGNVIHDWPDEIKMQLLTSAYEALPKGGYLVQYDYFFDEGKRENTSSFLMSIHMQLMCSGSQFTQEELKKMLNKVGFSEVQFYELQCQMNVCIAKKE